MKAKTKWVDFKELKEKVGMMDVLKHYGLLNDLQPKKNGELTGYCPIHDENQYKETISNQGLDIFRELGSATK